MAKGGFHTKRWAGWLLLAGGLVLATAGGWFVIEGANFLERTARTHGTIVALMRERSAKGLKEDHPVVRFVPPETGKPVEFKSRFGMWPSPFAVAERVEVAYDPADPVQARINSFWTIWFIPILICAFGLACLAAGLQTLRRTRRR